MVITVSARVWYQDRTGLPTLELSTVTAQFRLATWEDDLLGAWILWQTRHEIVV